MSGRNDSCKPDRSDVSESQRSGLSEPGQHGLSGRTDSSNLPPSMPQRNDFFERVWDVVARIPTGRVTTYGHIAEYLGVKSAARTVGWALNAAAGTGLPCHRVVNRYGALSGKRHFEGPFVMEERLRAEGIDFTDEDTVDLERHVWIPSEELPPVRFG